MELRNTSSHIIVVPFNRFSRSIRGTSEGQDLDLNSKYYLLFGKGNTRQSKITIHVCHCYTHVSRINYTYTAGSGSSGGFTFHQKTPKVSQAQVNPVKDSYSNMDQAMVESAEVLTQSLSVGQLTTFLN